MSKKVWLDSGAYLIIEPTEALTVVDVNTGKAVKKKNDKEKKVIELRLQEKTQYEIADILGLSQSYISRYLKSIMKKINKYF